MSELNPYVSPSDRPAPIRPVPELSPPQSVNYRFLEEDLIAAGQYTHQYSPEVALLQRKYQRRWFVVGLVMTTNACLAHLLLPGAPGFLKLTLFIVGLTLLLLAAIYPLRVQRLVRRRMKIFMRSGVIRLSDAPRSVTICRDGVATEEPHVSSMVGWPAIERVRVTEKHLFIFWQPLSPITVPLHAFATEESFQAYCQLAERLWEEQREPA